MSLKIVHYPDPVLRQKGEKIGQVSPEHIELARQMLETMREANGVGLAAQQIGRALQLAVVDVTDCEQPSQIFVGVKEVPVESLMPLVLIN
ncbi:MAG: peptide deformylase, partial [Verrucomicrobiae bacterium]|nr:peptide deformylase [Verrucomicrobiae bacterium]